MDEVLFDAIDNNSITLDFIHREIDKGHIRPSLLYQINNRISNSLLLTKSVLRLDKSFKPILENNKSINLEELTRWILSKVIDKYYNSFLYKIKIRAEKLFKDAYKDWLSTYHKINFHIFIFLLILLIGNK